MTGTNKKQEKQTGLTVDAFIASNPDDKIMLTSMSCAPNIYYVKPCDFDYVSIIQISLFGCLVLTSSKLLSSNKNLQVTGR